MNIIYEEKFMINMEKCSFMIFFLTFVGFVISEGTLKMEKDKVSAILSWATTKTSATFRSFHILATL